MALLENLTLLVVTAGLTGFLVPVVKGKIDHRKLLEQKLFEADLSRQTKVIESQSVLLERLGHLLWAQVLRVVEVSYRAYRGEEEAFREAWKRYDMAVWAFFLETRAEMSRARQLTSEAVCVNRDGMYQRFMQLDGELDRLQHAQSLDEDTWGRFHAELLGPVANEVDASLRLLAREIKLSPHILTDMCA